MYLLCCAVLFAVLATYKPHRFEWSVLAIVTGLVFVNTMLLDHNGSALYWNRAVITFIGTILLIKPWSTLGFYHSLILVATLGAYGVLEYHVTEGTHQLIRIEYKAFIYGLVGCQLIGIFPTVWASYRDFNSSDCTIMEYLQRNFVS